MIKLPSSSIHTFFRPTPSPPPKQQIHGQQAARNKEMATLGGDGGEPLDGENGSYRSDGEGDEYDKSTTDGNEEPAVVLAPFPMSEERESLGFLRATRRLALPGVGFDEGKDDGSVVAVAALDLFGLLLVSSATGSVHCCVLYTVLKRDVHRRR